MSAIHPLSIAAWRGPFRATDRQEAIDALESGEVLYLPELTFLLTDSEQGLLTPTLSDGKSKNISLGPDGKLKNTSSSPEEQARLQGMMQRYAETAVTFINDLFPQYTARLERARTSYRPVEIAGRKASVLQDDTRLHIDAFPTRPMKRGRRILRLFSNINPTGVARIWHVGEPFEDMARKILPSVWEPNPAKNLLLAALFFTRGIRSPYDSLMHGLHDEAKQDDAYQKNSPQIEFAFPPGSTWLCYTDQVMHAAISGQYVLEQTFHLDLEAMVHPDRAPFKVLERMMGRSLG
jgi:hypothetical protein